jgi:uncharacterized damage-inducible protein DinB
MYRKIDDFLKAWAWDTESTEKVFRTLTDRSLSQRVSPEGRTLGRIAWHIVQTLPEMCNRTGLEVVGPGEDDPIPSSAAEIAARFKEAADSLGAQVEANWTDASLDVEDEMYGASWTRGQTLVALVGHQAHHRGQMTVLMRQAGLRVPGVYGPSKEEWSDYGMPPHE